MPRASQILFVCTGNVFRSMTAEFAARQAHITDMLYEFRSAGTHSRPDSEALPYVGEYLRRRGLEAAGHVPRLLDKSILGEASLVIAMNDDHKAWIENTFERDCRLFMEVATGQAASLPDVCDVIEDHTKEPDAANRHIAHTIDVIINHSAQLIDRLPLYLK